jgi:hypothetical protein
VAVLADAAEAGPAWLTAVLGQAGALAAPRVVAVEARPNPAFNSSVTHLALQYDRPGSSGPDRLVLKLNRDRWGQTEVGLYRLAMAARPPVPTLVPCYDAAYDPRTGASHCLLLDLSETHSEPLSRDRATALDGVPSPRHLDATVDALADFHAYFVGLSALVTVEAI